MCVERLTNFLGDLFALGHEVFGSVPEVWYLFICRPFRIALKPEGLFLISSPGALTDLCLLQC